MSGVNIYKKLRTWAKTGRFLKSSDLSLLEHMKARSFVAFPVFRQYSSTFKDDPGTSNNKKQIMEFLKFLAILESEFLTSGSIQKNTCR